MASIPFALPSELPPDEDHRVALEAVYWSECSVATIFIILRFWARILKHSLGLDDVFMAVCYVLFLAKAVVITYVAETGGTRHFFYLDGLPEMNSTVMYYIIILDIGVFITGLGKIAIGITILRIFGNTLRWQRWTVWILIALTVSTGTANFCLSTFICGDPVLTWTLEAQATANCVSPNVQRGFNLFSNIIQVLVDFTFSVLPMAIVWGLRMPRHQKIFLVTALGLTLLTGAAGTVKTTYAATMDVLDLSWAIFPPLVWFSTEAMLIIVCGSVPLLHPLYERYITQRGLGYRSQDSSNFNLRTYINSDLQANSKVSSAKTKKDLYSSGTCDNLLLTTLNNPDEPRVQQELGGFELPQLDRNPLQSNISASATRHNPDMRQNGAINVFREFDVTSTTKVNLCSSNV